MTGRELTIPEPLVKDFDAYLNRCIDAAAKARETIAEFDDLLETGFKGRERDLVDDFIAELDAIEADTDNANPVTQRPAQIELDMNPLDAMSYTGFWTGWVT